MHQCCSILAACLELVTNDNPSATPSMVSLVKEMVNDMTIWQQVWQEDDTKSLCAWQFSALCIYLHFPLRACSMAPLNLG